MPVPAAARPQMALLLPCLDPELVPNVATATAAQIAVERGKVALWGACNRRKFAELVTWVRVILLGEPTPAAPAPAARYGGPK